MHLEKSKGEKLKVSIFLPRMSDSEFVEFQHVTHTEIKVQTFFKYSQYLWRC